MVTQPSEADYRNPEPSRTSRVPQRALLPFRPRTRVPCCASIENMTMGTAAVGYLPESMHGAGFPPGSAHHDCPSVQLEMKKELAKKIARIKVISEQTIGTHGAPVSACVCVIPYCSHMETS